MDQFRRLEARLCARLAAADHNFDPEWNGRWVRWGAELDELIEPDRDGRLEQGEAQAREQTNRVLARR
jgi:hypothetical protein